MNQAVLHIDFISLRTKEHAAILEAAKPLKEIDGVLEAGGVMGIEGSDFELALFFVLDDFQALEPFGTDKRYTQFLQGVVAPVLKAFSGVDVRLEGEMPPVAAYCAFLALAAPEESYDWEIRQRLNERLSNLGGDVQGVVGLAVGERQRFRGAALVFSPQPIAIGPKPANLDTIQLVGRGQAI